MNKAIAAVLVIAIVAGVFVLDGNALLRAGRDRIERFKQAMEHQREAPAAKRETPICWPAPGKFSVGAGKLRNIFTVVIWPNINSFYNKFSCIGTTV